MAYTCEIVINVSNMQATMTNTVNFELQIINTAADSSFVKHR